MAVKVRVSAFTCFCGYEKYTVDYVPSNIEKKSFF
jgi:hypothetical protein